MDINPADYDTEDAFDGAVVNAATAGECCARCHGFVVMIGSEELDYGCAAYCAVRVLDFVQAGFDARRVAVVL